MSVIVAPFNPIALPTLMFPVKRTSIWKTRTQQNVSGKEVRLADWSYPKYQWSLAFSGLRQGGPYASTEFAQILDFFDTLQGAWDSFLYQDADDFGVRAQPIGVGDGTTTAWQLVRSPGAWTSMPANPPAYNSLVPIFAPQTASNINVYNNGNSVDSSNWNVTPWDATSSFGPGILHFIGGYVPAAGHVLTADFKYYWPCRFDDDTLEFDKFISYAYEAQKITFTSIK
jgi:uncharacterized protein (TIGR02217 family)